MLFLLEYIVTYLPTKKCLFPTYHVYIVVYMVQIYKIHKKVVAICGNRSHYTIYSWKGDTHFKKLVYKFEPLVISGKPYITLKKSLFF